MRGGERDLAPAGRAHDAHAGAGKELLDRRRRRSDRGRRILRLLVVAGVVHRRARPLSCADAARRRVRRAAGRALRCVAYDRWRNGAWAAASSVNTALASAGTGWRPMSARSSLSTCQPGRACAGGWIAVRGRAARGRRRLTNVPSVSAKVAIGSRTSAISAVAAEVRVEHDDVVELLAELRDGVLAVRRRSGRCAAGRRRARGRAAASRSTASTPSHAGGEHAQAGGVRVLVALDEEVVVERVGRRPGEAGEPARERLAQQALEEEDLLVGRLRRDDAGDRARRRARRAPRAAGRPRRGARRSSVRTAQPSPARTTGCSRRPSPWSAGSSAGPRRTSSTGSRRGCGAGGSGRSRRARWWISMLQPVAQRGADRRRVLEVPDARAEAEVLGGERADRADVDDVAGVRVVEPLAGSEVDLAVVAALEDRRARSVFGDLVEEARAARAQDAALLVEHDERADVDRLVLLDLVLERERGSAAGRSPCSSPAACTRRPGRRSGSRSGG